MAASLSDVELDFRVLVNSDVKELGRGAYGEVREGLVHKITVNLLNFVTFLNIGGNTLLSFGSYNI